MSGLSRISGFPLFWWVILAYLAFVLIFQWLLLIEVTPAETARRTGSLWG